MDGLLQCYYERCGDLINQDQGHLFHQGVEFAVVKQVHGQMQFLTSPASSLNNSRSSWCIFWHEITAGALPSLHFFGVKDGLTVVTIIWGEENQSINQGRDMTRISYVLLFYKCFILLVSSFFFFHSIITFSTCTA